jgi:hypothetical protein
MWDASPQGMTAFNGVATDAEGRFRLEADHRNRPIAVLVLDRERRRGAVSRFSARSFGKDRDLTLEPLVRLRGTFFSKELNAAPAWTNVYVHTLPGRSRVLQCGSMEATFDLLLPPGDFGLFMYGEDVRSVTREQWVEGDEETIDLQTIDLPATRLALLYGKPFPVWKVTDARGVSKEVQVSDYRGRYVLIEFWGFW